MGVWLRRLCDALEQGLDLLGQESDGVLAGKSERGLNGGSAAESASSGVGRRPIVRVRTRLEGGGSPD